MGLLEPQDVGPSHAGSERWARAGRAGALCARESLHICMRACVPSCYRDASMCTFGRAFARCQISGALLTQVMSDDLRRFEASDIVFFRVVLSVASWRANLSPTVTTSGTIDRVLTAYQV